ncbi:hypothetical protein MPSEU_000876300 [Mayamaea pseudoterrestris]|nr:hypothetical protein MPSEU_000876300 [Mayamaea pseudoterrestris]
MPNGIAELAWPSDVSLQAANDSSAAVANRFKRLGDTNERAMCNEHGSLFAYCKCRPEARSAFTCRKIHATLSKKATGQPTSTSRMIQTMLKQQVSMLRMDMVGVDVVLVFLLRHESGTS